MEQLSKIQAQEKALERQMEKEKAESKKRIARIAKNLGKTRRGYPFRCRKCGLAFRTSEIVYKVHETIRNRHDFQPMGDYDVWQETVHERLGCCPKCGKNFLIPVAEPEIIDITDRYGRYDNRTPNFKPVGSKCISAIKKLDRSQIKYVNDQFKL